MLTLFGHPGSTCTRKVLCTLAELNVAHTFTLVDFAKGEHKQPANLARQPFGRVPSIDDDGFAMFESRAIIRYLNDKHQGALMPGDVQGRARAEQWTSIEYSYFAPNSMKFIYQHVFGRPQDEATIKAATAGLDEVLDVMDARLAKVSYLAGDSFSLADVGFLPYAEYLMITPAKEQLTRRPNVAAWWTRCSERPSWRKAAGR